MIKVTVVCDLCAKIMKSEPDRQVAFNVMQISWQRYYITGDGDQQSEESSNEVIKHLCIECNEKTLGSLER